MEIFGFTFSSGELWLLGICGALIMALIAHRLALNLQKRNAFNSAATTFRNKVLTAVQGIYPIPPVWQPQDYPRFKQSIPEVETAAAEFKPFIKRRTGIDAAVKEYRDYCQKKTYESASAWEMYTSMRDPGDIGPVETFRKIVEHLLSFAERN